MEELDEIQIHPDFPEHKVQIGSRLDPNIRIKLIDFLFAHYDCFAWSHAGMTVIDPKVIVHKL